ncbi:nucleotide exchange factor GrpE [Marinimicrobium sp. C6131]|uniref:nucleotide exchange factor GrpE n=1 Tax=Marinimicrobium sp. C6131 TaxID=3022676 RepID=UPI00223D2342|nr:nucleotide exchange factor GrpE [Marinimicrobium sp. C6131]UZJ43010.1 nucleotide exchange factor GrpE [Marinimicrobium sp. C6131]
MANEDNRDAQEYEEVAAETESAETDTDTPGGDEPGEESVEALKARIDSLSAAMEAAKEQVLRSQAEAQNARRRAEQDVEKAHKFGQEKLLQDLLPVVDNLERALAAMDTDNPDLKAVVEGIQLTHKSFIDALAKYHVEPVDPRGEPFDPERHQAMTMVANPDVEPNTVIDVFQKGYTLHGRLVRPAMVVVSKGAE